MSVKTDNLSPCPCPCPCLVVPKQGSCFSVVSDLTGQLCLQTFRFYEEKRNTVKIYVLQLKNHKQPFLTSAQEFFWNLLGDKRKKYSIKKIGRFPLVEKAASTNIHYKQISTPALIISLHSFKYQEICRMLNTSTLQRSYELHFQSCTKGYVSSVGRQISLSFSKS